MSEEKLYTLDEARAALATDAAPVADAADEAASTTLRTVDVDGVTVTVDLRRVSSWRAARLIAKADNPETGEFQRIAAMIELYEFIFADGLPAVLEYFGGEYVADMRAVMAFFQQLMDALNQKK